MNGTKMTCVDCIENMKKSQQMIADALHTNLKNKQKVANGALGEGLAFYAKKGKL